MDRREQILARLADVLGTIAPTFRNRGELPDDKRPAITLLDADELTKETPMSVGTRISIAPKFISLQPEIYIALDSRKPDNKNTGQDLNVLRVKIVKAVCLDGVLITLVGSNGRIEYNGCITDLARNRDMAGEMGLIFAFVYIINPSEL